MKTGSVITFLGGYVRPLVLSDVYDAYVDGLNDPEVNRYLDSVRRSRQTHDTVSEFVNSHVNSENSVLWGIWQDGCEKACGTVRLHEIEHRHQTALIGICIFDKSAWGKGLGAMALGVITKWAMSELDIKWIEAGIFADNIASQRVFMSAGYEWMYDISGKYILEGVPATVKIYAARKIV